MRFLRKVLDWQWQNCPKMKQEFIHERRNGLVLLMKNMAKIKPLKVKTLMKIISITSSSLGKICHFNILVDLWIVSNYRLILHHYYGNLISNKNKTGILLTCNCVSTFVWLHHLDSYESIGEKTSWKPLKTAVCCFKQILEASPYKTALYVHLPYI